MDYSLENLHKVWCHAAEDVNCHEGEENRNDRQDQEWYQVWCSTLKQDVTVAGEDPCKWIERDKKIKSRIAFHHAAHCFNAVQRRREIEPESEHVRQRVSDVAVEHVDGAQRNCKGDCDEKLDKDDEWKRKDPHGEMARVDQVERKEREQADAKLKDAPNDIGNREGDLREGNLAQHLITLPNRLRSCAERRTEPFPGEKDDENKEGKVWLVTLSNEGHQDRVDNHL